MILLNRYYEITKTNQMKPILNKDFYEVNIKAVYILQQFKQINSEPFTCMIPQGIDFEKINERHLATSVSHLQEEKRPRKNLTKEMVKKLNEVFTLYSNEKKYYKFSLQYIANYLQLGYSTVLRKYRQFKAYLYVPEGKKLASSSKIYSKSRLVRSLILRSFQEQSHFQTSAEISIHILNSYGFNYKKDLICRELRRMGIQKRRQQYYLPQSKIFEESCVEYLLQGLLKSERKMTYFGKYQFIFQDETEICIVLLATKNGVVIRVLEDDTGLAGVFTGMIQELYQKFNFKFDSFWYIITSEEDLVSKQTTQDFFQTDNIFFNILPIKPKIVMLPSSYHSISPTDHLYEQIAFKICKSSLDYRQILTILPHWFNTQMDTACKQVEKSQADIINFDPL